MRSAVQRDDPVLGKFPAFGAVLHDVVMMMQRAQRARALDSDEW